MIEIRVTYPAKTMKFSNQIFAVFQPVIRQRNKPS
jgi:hypothetical protein